MVNRNKKKLNNRNIKNPNCNHSLLPSTCTDELIKLLSEKRENQRAKQAWEWEQVRRNSELTRITNFS